MHRLGMPVSDDTILRQLKRDNPASIQKDTIRVVGIDDWSWRHSSRYGTIMVDLERHSVVDVLEDRSVESAKAWLQERPTIEVVSRDRCGLYAQAAREGAPQARQVAEMLSPAPGHNSAVPAWRTGSRQEIFDMLQALRQQGLTYSEIARRTGYERRSIANWLTLHPETETGQH